MTVLMSAVADRDLWARAVGGDSAAFGLLFERHARAVYNFAFRRTANWAEAEDVMSDVFLVAWRRRRTVQLTTDGESVLPWLLGVTLNVVRNRTRTRWSSCCAYSVSCHPLITILPVLALLLFGGDTLEDFAFALLVGVVSGAYSSIFIAAPLLTTWKERGPEYARRRGDVPKLLGLPRRRHRVNRG